MLNICYICRNRVCVLPEGCRSCGYRPAKAEYSCSAVPCQHGAFGQVPGASAVVLQEDPGTPTKMLLLTVLCNTPSCDVMFVSV